MSADWSPSGKAKSLRVKRPLELLPDQSTGVSRKVPSRTNEFWSLEFDNGLQPDVWCSLKFLKVYTLPVADSREEDEG